MSDIRLMLTSVGGLVSPGIIESLRRADETVYIVGIDMQPDAIGFYFVDKSHVVPRGDSSDYIPCLMEMAKKENVQVIVPCSDEELLSISKTKSDFGREGIIPLCSDYETVSIAIDKGTMLEFLKTQAVPTPRFYLPKNTDALIRGAEALGYPDNPVVVKPRRSRGGRGFRILKEQIDLFGSRDSHFIKLNHLIEIIKEYEEFPSIVLMEYLPGEEYSVDALADNGESIYIVPRKRIQAIGGPSQIGEVVHNGEVVDMVRSIIKAFKLDFNVNVQLKYSKQSEGQPLVYEINPRISGTIVANEAAGVNLLYYGIRKAMGLDIPGHVRLKEVRMIRYLKEYFIYGDGEFSS